MRTSLNVPEDVLREFDDTWQAEGLDSRSRAIREAMAEYVESHTELERTTGTVAAAVVFDYEHTAVIEQLHDVQHEHQDVISATSHTHQGDWCLETLFCRGEVGPIRELVYRLKDFDSVRRVNVMLIEVRE
jgi:CopG family transcriptional regulator, nickel-responsive regulator